MTARVLLCCEDERHAAPYVEALVAVGGSGDAVRLVTPATDYGDPEALAAMADGMILCGGPDVEPWRYGEEPLAAAGLELKPELDALEWRLLAGALRARTPVWGICRGLQTLNVFLGGTLWQDIRLQCSGAEEHQVGQPLDALPHVLRLAPRGHPLADLLSDGPVRVNSRHHQAVRELASALVPLGHTPDGLLEVAAAAAHDWWAWAVQWHPENLLALPAQRALWRAFLGASTARADPVVGARATSG